MKTNLYFLIVLLGFLFYFHGETLSQEILSSKDFIGTWTYIGPKKTIVGDTIVLTKDQSLDSTYSKWTFQTKDNELLIISQQQKTKDGPNYTIGVAPKGIKWSYDNKGKVLVIQREDDQYFNVISNQGQRIMLIKIK
jgi:hypothetical protein